MDKKQHPFQLENQHLHDHGVRRKSLGVVMGGVSLGPGCVTENLIAMTGQMKLTLSAQVGILHKGRKVISFKTDRED